MTVPLLVVTPQASFGGLIRKSLNSETHDIFVTADFSEAIRYVRKANCPLAILDAELNDIDISVVDVGYALQQIKEDIQFIFVMRSGQERDTGRISPLATLTKPISIPELQKYLKKAVPSETRETISASPIPEKILAETSRLMWLKDVSKAAQHLTRLTLESSAQAALITRQDELWAYAGQLSREAAEELARSIRRYWDEQAQSDLLRFVRLQSTEAQHMLYATKLSTNMILALVFDAETPFSTIRTQAGKLVRTLADGGFDNKNQQAQASLSDFGPAEENDEDLPPISDLLGDIPSPIPEKRMASSQRITLPWEENPPGEKATQSSPSQPIAPPDKRAVYMPTNFSQETSPAVRISSSYMSIESDKKTESEPTPDELDVDLKEMAKTRVHVPSDMAATRRQELSKEDTQSMIETRPSSTESVTEVAHRILLEPASPALVNLSYACLLIPRFDTHHLVGDLADRVTEWIPQVCVAFGWRLEHFSIRPEYLQWVVRVPPSTAPGYIMRIVRQQTSERIFSDFPRFKVENPSGDFWAPGYLIMGSSEPHPPKLVRDFIKQTRHRQGIEHH